MVTAQGMQNGEQGKGWTSSTMEDGDIRLPLIAITPLPSLPLPSIEREITDLGSGCVPTSHFLVCPVPSSKAAVSDRTAR